MSIYKIVLWLSYKFTVVFPQYALAVFSLWQAVHVFSLQKQVRVFSEPNTPGSPGPGLVKPIE